MPSIQQMDFTTAKGLAQYKSVISVNRFAQSVDIATGDSNVELWDRAHNLTYLTAASDFFISSDNVNDDQQILVVAMDENFEFRPFFITLNGQTPVLVSADFKFLRCVRVENLDSTSYLGDLYVSTGVSGHTLGVPNDNADIQCFSSAEKQQASMSHFTIPGAFWGLITSLGIGVLNNGNTQPTNADIEFRTRVTGRTFITKGKIPINSEGSNVISIQGLTGRLVAPRTDIQLRVIGVGRADTQITVNYTVELYRSKFINPPIIVTAD